MSLITDSRLEYLFERYFEKSSTQEEERELLTLIEQAKNDDQLKYLMDRVWTRLSPEYRLSDEQSGRILSDILSSLPRKRRTRRMINRRILWLGGVAAAVLLLFAGGWMWYKNNSKGKQDKIAVVATPSGNDVAPGGNKAVLILGNGSSVVLDSALNGMVAQQGNTRIVKLNGQLSYQGLPAKNVATVYNTIITPPRGQYSVILPDGSKVWLNAASSLHFPTTFTGTERAVKLAGEAYFEVAENKDMPFKVSVDGMEVKVLGTHFDIMAYHNEPAIRTTLLEGSVAVSKGSEHVILKPGQQASLLHSGDHIQVNKADTEAVTAWKNGLFLFRGTDIRSVLREIARWYGTDVVYKGAISAHLNGMISRNTDLSQVLHMLEVTSDVKFRIGGKKIIVMSSDGDSGSNR